MLAVPWPAPFDDDEWWFEVKWDGYRCIATGTSTGAALRSRRGLDLGARFPAIAGLAMPQGWIVDGEVVALDDQGRSDFSLLQTGSVAPSLIAFDVLRTPTGPAIGLPIESRWELLDRCPLPDVVVRNARVRADGVALGEAVESQGLEGIVAKRSASTYQPGKRSPDWRKVAFRHRVTAVVGGWLPGEGSRAGSFGSLLLGLWDEAGLRWIGAVGSGFNDASLRPIRAALEDLERPTPAFASTRLIPRGARWVEPGIVVEVEYKEWTREGRLRAPVFKAISQTPVEAVTWADEGPA